MKKETKEKLICAFVVVASIFHTIDTGRLTYLTALFLACALGYFTFHIVLWIGLRIVDALNWITRFEHD